MKPETGPTPIPGAKRQSYSGYLEWRRDGEFVVEGQRIRWHAGTRTRIRDVASLEAIPLGYEINVKGVRLTDGSVLADELEAKPNGRAAFEGDVRNIADQIERAWVTEGRVSLFADGSRREVGRVLETGSDVERARRIVRRLLPPYLSATQVRVRVIDTSVWNASAMGNGAIWVNTGLLNDMASDDELAIILGHELAHYTHEHQRRSARTSFWAQLANLGAQVAIGHIDNPSGAAAADVGRWLSLQAWQNGYSRNLEDQADRVGLRYAFEAGFDITVGVTLWQRVLAHNGQADRVSNFLLGTHSRPSERIRNIERELTQNYALGGHR